MEWYFVLLIFVVYFMGVGFTSSLLLNEFDKLSDESSSVLAMFWSPVLCILIGSLIWSKIFNR